MFGLVLDPRLQDTATMFLAIVIEAIPFMILGVLVSNLLGIFISDKWLLKLLPKNRFTSHIAAASLGVFFPVCECGNVPVARKLLIKGFSPSQAISFFLGAPIINIVVLASTIAAFGNVPVIVVSRFVGGFLIAVLVGIIISYIPKTGLLADKLQKRVDYEQKHAHSGSISANHHDHGDQEGFPQRLKHVFSRDFLQDFSTEFYEMGALLIIGAGVAALSQVWLPRDFVYFLNSTPLLAILAMMSLAFIISVCSSVDAFVALGYSFRFSPAAISSFLIFGPMIDIKAVSMLLTTYKAKVVALMVVLVALLTILFSLGLSVLGY